MASYNDMLGLVNQILADMRGGEGTVGFVTMTKAGIDGVSTASPEAFSEKYEPDGWALAPPAQIPSYPGPMRWMGAWSSTIFYNVGDVVTLSSVAYVSLAINLNVSPPNASFWAVWPGGGTGGVTVQDEGTPLATAGTTLNFVGTGVVASGTGATKTITITGGGAGSDTTALHTTGDFTKTSGTTAFEGLVTFKAGIPHCSLRAFGADPTGVADCTTALANAEAVLAALTGLAGGVIEFGPGTFAFGDSGFSPNNGVTYRGAGWTQTVIVPLGAAQGALGFTSGTGNWVIEHMQFNLWTFATMALELHRCTRSRVRNCRFKLQGSYGVLIYESSHAEVEDNFFLGKGDLDDHGTAVQMSAGCRNIGIRRNRMRWCSAAVVGAGGGSSNYDTAVSEEIDVSGNEVDGGWFAAVARYSGSGGTVSYTSTTVTDSGASFGTIASNATIRAMPVRVGPRTATTVTTTQVTDSGASYVSSGVRKGDIIVFGSTFALVANVESATALGIERWTSKANNDEIFAAPSTGTQYTIYRVIVGTRISNTSTAITVARWQDLDGTVVTPTANTLYEACYAPTSHPMYFEAGFRYVKVHHNTCRRGWGDQIRFLGKYCSAIGNIVEDGFDVGIEAEGGSHCVIADNIVRGQGVWGILARQDCTVTGNVVTDTPWLNPFTVPIVVGGSRTVVSGNNVSRGRVATYDYAIIVQATESGTPVDYVTITGNVLGGCDTAMVGLSPTAANVTNTQISGNTNPESVLLYGIVAGGSGTVSGTFDTGSQVRSAIYTASRTATLADVGTVVEMNVASANNYTLAPASAVPWAIGQLIEVYQKGAGQTTFVEGSGVTFETEGSRKKITGQYAAAQARYRGSDVWALSGSLTT